MMDFVHIYNDNRYKSKINVKKIAFGNKEHITDKKMGVSVLFKLFISRVLFIIAQHMPVTSRLRSQTKKFYI